MASATAYNKWTRDGLIDRIRQLERELHERPARASATATAAATAPPASSAEAPAANKAKRAMDPSRYASRRIALKIAYLGKNYGGFEFQAAANQSSIEEELWKALTKACLIFPRDDKVVDWDCCDYSKCGRTDKGVSAFGQVVGLTVRSNRPLHMKTDESEEGKAEGGGAMADAAADHRDGTQKPFDPVLDELAYPRLLNRLLPPDIRVLAWCPCPPPNFSARFSCRERQYRYFFTQPAFAPTPAPTSPSASASSSPSSSHPPTSRDVPAGPGPSSGWLNIEAMRDAARRFEGEHDFRNLCKTDAAKQITNFVRVIFESDIKEVASASSALPYLNGANFSSPHRTDWDGPLPRVYSFNVRGSAFLWHQIRHMVAILFLVGQGLESPSVVTELLDVTKTPRKPTYTMADEVPLVLWDCIFPHEGDPDRKDALRWVYEKDAAGGHFSLANTLWSTWRERKMDELLANQLMREVARQGGEAAAAGGRAQGKGPASTKMFEGGNGARCAGRYVPVMKKDRMETPAEQNEKWAKRKGFASSEDMRAQKGFKSGKVAA